MEARRGFTLIELMIVVAIIGLLVAIAIPNFAAMQYRTKRAEVPTNVNGIKTAEIAYEAAFDAFVPETQFKPSSTVGKQAKTWTTGSHFDTLGWAPDGVVRGAYKITTTNNNFKVIGICDVDGNGSQATYTAQKSTSTEQMSSNSIY